MKRLLVALLLTIASSQFIFAQQIEADALLKEGVALHDAGKYEEAIAKYDAAFKLNPKLIGALYEKAYSLSSLGKNEEALEIAKMIIKDHQDYDEIANVYMIAGNALDDLKRTDEALKIYDEGIKHFPQINLFYFNKALALSKLGKTEDAIDNLRQDVVLKPTHASGHRFLALYYEDDRNTVPAMYAHGVFLLLESKGKRAEVAFESLQKLTKGNASVDPTKPNTINISMSMSDKKKKEDDFSTSNMSLGFISALGLSKKIDSITGQKSTDIDNLKSAFSMVIEVKGDKKNKGFGWKYYAPFYVEMKQKDFMETFANLCFRATDSKESKDWIAANGKKVQDFYDWMEAYQWPKKVD